VIASSDDIKPELRKMDNYIDSLEEVLRPDVKKKGFHVLNVSKKLNMQAFIKARKAMQDRLRET